jgi:hypothetical protein
MVIREHNNGDGMKKNRISGKNRMRNKKKRTESSMKIFSSLVRG